jgi:hypothetical protein
MDSPNTFKVGDHLRQINGPCQDAKFRFRVTEVEGTMVRVVLDPHVKGFNQTPEWSHHTNFIPYR